MLCLKPCSLVRSILREGKHSRDYLVIEERTVKFLDLSGSNHEHSKCDSLPDSLYGEGSRNVREVVMAGYKAHWLGRVHQPLHLIVYNRPC